MEPEGVSGLGCVTPGWAVVAANVLGVTGRPSHPMDALRAFSVLCTPARVVGRLWSRSCPYCEEIPFANVPGLSVQDGNLGSPKSGW